MTGLGDVLFPTERTFRRQAQKNTQNIVLYPKGNYQTKEAFRRLRSSDFQKFFFSATTHR